MTRRSIKRLWPFLLAPVLMGCVTAGTGDVPGPEQAKLFVLAHKAEIFPKSTPIGNARIGAPRAFPNSRMFFCVQTFEQGRKVNRTLVFSRDGKYEQTYPAAVYADCEAPYYFPELEGG